MSKRFISFFLCLVIVLGSFSSIFAANPLSGNKMLEYIGICSVDTSVWTAKELWGYDSWPSTSLVSNSETIKAMNSGKYPIYDISLNYKDFMAMIMRNCVDYNYAGSLPYFNTIQIANEYDLLCYLQPITEEELMYEYNVTKSKYAYAESDTPWTKLIKFFMGALTQPTTFYDFCFTQQLANLIGHHNEDGEPVRVTYTNKGYTVKYYPFEGYIKLEYTNDSHISYPYSGATRDYKTVYYVTKDSSYYGGGSSTFKEQSIYTQDGDIQVGDTSNYTYNQNPVDQTVMDYHGQASLNVASGGSVSVADTGTLFDMSSNHWFTPTYYNYYYTTTNNYSYYYYNYYMPGSDEPFSTYTVYYELPDGRSSADLTLDDVKGKTYGFDCVNYTIATEDPYQQALFHFDGDVSNSGAYNPLTLSSIYYAPTSYTGFTFYNDTESYRVNNTVLPVSASLVFSNILPGDYTISFDLDFRIYDVTPLKVSLYRGNSSICTFTNITTTITDVLSFTYSFHNSTVQDYSIRFSMSGSRAPYYNYYYASNVSLNQQTWSADSIVQQGTNPTKFVQTENASYTFVTTGDDNYKAALFFSGLSHKFQVVLTDGCFRSGLDWTCTWRYYQELSTSTADNYVYFGGTNASDCEAYLKYNGSKFIGLWYRGNNLVLNSDIPYGVWNTITIVSANGILYCYVNGVQIGSIQAGSSTVIAQDLVSYSMAADELVKYFDEFMFANVSLYTSGHVPRLVPYDTSNVLVLPDSTRMYVPTIAVMSIVPVNGFAIGGARQTYPDEGEVYCHLSNGKIDSCQQWNGYQWLECDCRIGYLGTWYSPGMFNVSTRSADFDGTSDIGVIPEDNRTWYEKLIDVILKPINTIASAVGGGITTLFDTLANIVGTIGDFVIELLSSLVQIIVQWFEDIGDLVSNVFRTISSAFNVDTGVAAIFTDVWEAIPVSLQNIIVGCISLVIMIGVFKIIL